MRVCGLHDEHLRCARHGNAVRPVDFGHGHRQHVDRRPQWLDAEKFGLPIFLCTIYCGGRAGIATDSVLAAKF